MKTAIKSLQILLVAAAFGQPAFALDKVVVSKENTLFLANYEKLKKQNLVDFALKKHLWDEYKALSWNHIDRSELHTLPDSEMLGVLDVLNLMAFFTNDVEIVKSFANVARELEKRGKLPRNQDANVLKSLIAARLFEDARSFKGVHPDLPQKIPVLTDLDRVAAQTILEVDGDSGNVTRRNFSFPVGGFVIIVGSPYCHFSSDAADAINGDAKLSSRLAGRVQWIVPQFRGLHPDAVRVWNSDHKESKFVMAYRSAEWPQINSWETPVFYFFLDGVLVDSLTGWRPDHMSILQRKLRDIGLLSGS